MKKLKMVEDYYKRRDELNALANYLVKNSPRHKSNMSAVIFVLCFAIFSLLLLIGSLIAYAQKPPVYNIEQTYPARIINNYPEKIINTAIHLEPEYVANCVKVRAVNSSSYMMSCEVIK